MDAPPASTIQETQADDPRSINALTVVSIAIVSYLLAVPIIHEGLGHGLTAAVLGAKGIRLTSAAVFYDDQSVPQEKSRILSIAGPVTSLLCGLLLAIFHRYNRSKNAEFRYFVWLTAYVCLFQGGGYLMALSFVPFGDIDLFVKGLDYEFAWRLALSISGADYIFYQFICRRARSGRVSRPESASGKSRQIRGDFLLRRFGPVDSVRAPHSRAGWLPICLREHIHPCGSTVFCCM